MDKNTKYCNEYIGDQYINLPNLLMIAGNGRNTGKTTLGCKIVSEISVNQIVYAIKVSSHFHEITSAQELVFENENLHIMLENNRLSNKDSSRYLKAGAQVAWYVQCSEMGLPMLAKWISRNIPANIPVVCESGGLGKLINPGYAIYVKNHQNSAKVLDWKFHFETITGHSEIEKNVSLFKWRNGKWEK